MRKKHEGKATGWGRSRAVKKWVGRIWGSKNKVKQIRGEEEMELLKKRS